MNIDELKKLAEAPLLEYTVYQKVEVIGMPKSFWMVTTPSEHSELLDIMFETDYVGIGLQFLGGLKPHEVVGVYAKKSQAEKVAKKLMGVI